MIRRRLSLVALALATLAAAACSNPTAPVARAPGVTRDLVAPAPKADSTGGAVGGASVNDAGGAVTGSSI